MDEKLNKIIEELKSRIRDMFSNDKSGHNIDHLERVMKTAVYIAKKEGDNMNVVAISAILHDIHRILADKERTFVSPKDSLPTIRELLKDIDITSEEKEHICYAIEHHEEYSFGGGTVTVTDIESKILQDADNIDAAGAIGIGRTFAFGAAHNCPQYTPEIPPEEGEYNEATFDESTIHHCVNKLARLDQTMNTKTGKEICTQRCEFIRLFVNQYLKEYNCLD